MDAHDARLRRRLPWCLHCGAPCRAGAVCCRRCGGEQTDVVVTAQRSATAGELLAGLGGTLVLSGTGALMGAFACGFALMAWESSGVRTVVACVFAVALGGISLGALVLAAACARAAVSSWVRAYDYGTSDRRFEGTFQSFLGVRYAVSGTVLRPTGSCFPDPPADCATRVHVDDLRRVVELLGEPDGFCLDVHFATTLARMSLERRLSLEVLERRAWSRAMPWSEPRMEPVARPPGVRCNVRSAPRADAPVVDHEIFHAAVPARRRVAPPTAYRDAADRTSAIGTLDASDCFAVVERAWPPARSGDRSSDAELRVLAAGLAAWPGRRALRAAAYEALSRHPRLPGQQLGYDPTATTAPTWTPWSGRPSTDVPAVP